MVHVKDTARLVLHVFTTSQHRDLSNQIHKNRQSVSSFYKSQHVNILNICHRQFQTRSAYPALLHGQSSQRYYEQNQTADVSRLCTNVNIDSSSD